jgi:hypothetical protein
LLKEQNTHTHTHTHTHTGDKGAVSIDNVCWLKEQMVCVCACMRASALGDREALCVYVCVYVCV